MRRTVTCVLWTLTTLVVVTATSPSTDQPATVGTNLDPMTSAPPREVFSARGRVPRDTEDPDYTAMVVTPQGHLVLVDMDNKKVKVMVTSSGAEPRVASSVRLAKEPWAIALLPDGKVAVTTNELNFMYILNLEDDVISYGKRFPTAKKYSGVAAGLSNGTLLVASRDYLDVITRQGEVVESFEVSAFRRPDYMCRHGNDVIVSDWASMDLYHVEAATGQVIATYANSTMEYPHQVATDAVGNIYVASRGSYRVIVRSPTGEWRTLLTSRREKLPTAIGVTDNGFVVTWSTISFGADYDITTYSDVKGYTLT